MSGRRLVAVDLGSSAVRCAIADDDGTRLRVLGVGEAPSAGVRKSVIIDPDAATAAISRALDLAERAAGVEVDSALLTLGGRHLISQSRRAVVSIASRSGAVGTGDLNRVLEAAREPSNLDGSEVVHLIPRSYAVDEMADTRDPRGVAGSRLGVDAELVLASTAHLEALVECAHAAGLRVDDVVAQPLAAAEGVVRDRELEGSVAVVDVGGGTTDIAVFRRGTIQRVRVLPVGGQNVTKDLATGLHCDLEEAENVKRRHGHCDPGQIRPEEMVTVVGMGGVGADEVPRRWLAEVIEPRAREMARLIGQILDEEDGVSRVVLTGGCARLQGFAAAVHQILEMPVRVAVPEGLFGLADQLGMPEHAATVGLLRWGQRSTPGRDHSNQRTTRSTGRLNRWLHELF
ncbi:MAG: cell division protein FtsA [Candidatus Dormibacteria bacterium]